MQEQHASPLNWLQTWAVNMGWPIVVVAAFWVGRYVQKLEMRAAKLESHLDSLTGRHMPAVHRALAEIRGLLVGGRQ